MRYTQKYVNLLLDTSEYYDFELVADNTPIWGDYLSNDDLVIDINICSGLTSSIRWTGATINTFDLEYITTTGLDNFFIDVPGAYSGGTVNTGITAHIYATDHFEFHPVSGWTTTLSYEILPDGSCLSKLNGGFYQGFFKLFGYPYELIPPRMKKGWTVDMIIKFPEGKTGTGTTLNDLFPTNQGFIFYFGTRAEDKYWNGFTTGTPSETSVLFNWSGLTITDPRYVTYYYSPNAGDVGASDIYYYHPRLTAGISDFLEYESYKDYGVGYGEIPPPDYLFYQATGAGAPSLNGFTYGYAYGGGASKTQTEPSLNPLTPSENAGNVYGGFTQGFSYGDGIITPNTFLGYSPLYTFGNQFVTTGHTTGSTSGTTIYTPYEGYYHYTNHKPYAERYFDNNTVPLFVMHPFRNIVDNAFGVRIRPDGHIGYRALYVGNICQTGTTINVSGYTTATTTTLYKIEEGYSPSPIWKANNNGFINLVIVFERYMELQDCELLYNKYRFGTLTFYVNGRPVYKQENFEEIIPHVLDRQKELQIGVPFNISWGGGTQGLLESVTYGGIDLADRDLMLQKLYAGTWTGELATFKMYIRPLGVDQIINNFEVRKNQYQMLGDFGGRYIFITKG
jgi:hypothetical protein